MPGGKRHSQRRDAARYVPKHDQNHPIVGKEVVLVGDYVVYAISDDCDTAVSTVPARTI
jgi:hypothetical protein